MDLYHGRYDHQRIMQAVKTSRRQIEHKHVPHGHQA